MQAIIRPYTPSDRFDLRLILGMDEFARPRLLEKYPLFSEYLADETSYYPDFEPESLFVADVQGQVALYSYRKENIPSAALANSLGVE